MTFCYFFSHPSQVDSQLASLDHNDPLELAAGYLTWLKAAPEPEDEVDFRPLLQVLASPDLSCCVEVAHFKTGMPI